MNTQPMSTGASKKVDSVQTKRTETEIPEKTERERKAEIAGYTDKDKKDRNCWVDRQRERRDHIWCTRSGSWLVASHVHLVYLVHLIGFSFSSNCNPDRIDGEPQQNRWVSHSSLLPFSLICLL